MSEWINSLEKPWNIIAWIGVAIAIMLLIWGATGINKYAFTRIKKKQKGMHLAFFERFSSLIIVVAILLISVSAFNGFDSVWHTMLGGTAIISAVVAFVAQDIIKDILAGLMISIHKPFEIGDRIVLENGTAGIVEDLTMRHVVLDGFDTIKYVIPNSKMNNQQVTNFGHHRDLQSAEFEFRVALHSDVGLVKKVIDDTVRKSKYTSPGLPEDGNTVYAPAYFVRFASSALVLTVLVYFEKKYPPEKVIDEINTSVFTALRENGIEIPYEYINVLSPQDAAKNKK